jgi:hypothetical protein
MTIHPALSHLLLYSIKDIMQYKKPGEERGEWYWPIADEVEGTVRSSSERLGRSKIYEII